MCRWFFSLLFLLFCRESELLQFKSSAQSEWDSHFPFRRSHCGCLHSFVVASAEKICAHRTYATVLLLWYGQTAKRLYLYTLHMIYKWSERHNQKPRASFISFFQFESVTVMLLLNLLPIWYISFFFICFFVHRSILTNLLISNV